MDIYVHQAHGLTYKSEIYDSWKKSEIYDT